MRKLAAPLIGVLCLLGATACRPSTPLPEGVQVVEGTLARADISLTRRGTHVLRTDETPLFYVESSAINLGVLEGRKVQLRGTFELNTDTRDLPVFVVTKVLKGGDEVLRQVVVPTLGISLSLPQSFKQKPETSPITFTASGSAAGALVVRRELSENLAFDFITMRAWTGSTLTVQPVVIAGRKSAEVSDAGGKTFAVYVDDAAGKVKNMPSVLSFVFVIDPALPAEQQRQLFRKILSTLSFQGASSSQKGQSGAGTGSGTALGKPCGGPAGVLCPAGYLCEITDTEQDIGHCKKR